MRTEVTYLERWPYSTNSLLPRIIGEAFWLPGVIGWSCARAWLAANSPNVTPPANAAPPLRSSLRLVRFESISPSFERNDTTTKSRARGREHMPPFQIWRVLMSRGLRILRHQLGGNGWLADPWLFIRHTDKAARSAQPHLRPTAAQAILKNVGWRFCSMAQLVFGFNQSLDGYVGHLGFAPGPP